MCVCGGGGEREILHVHLYADVNLYWKFVIEFLKHENIYFFLYHITVILQVYEDDGTLFFFTVYIYNDELTMASSFSFLVRRKS